MVSSVSLCQVIERGVKLLSRDARTVGGAHLGSGPEGLHKEFLKHIIESSLERNNS